MTGPTTSSTARVPRWYHGWNIVAAASLLTLLSVGMRLGIGPFFLPMAADLGFSRSLLASIVAAFLYVRVIKVMYFDEPVGAGPSVAYPSVLTATTIAVGAALTLVLGVIPGPVLDLAGVAGEFIR